MISQKTLKTWSVLSFVISIISLVVVNWYFYGYGILFMLVFISIGLIFDQISRIYFPATAVNNYDYYKKNRLLKMWGLVLFILSPIALIYSSQLFYRSGFVVFIILIGIGICLDQMARIRYPYTKA